MKALVIKPGIGRVQLAEREEPRLLSALDIKLRILQVGICGTDREEASGGRAQAPAGQTELIIGHEMLGSIVEVGMAVASARPGDFGVLTVRRGCNHCTACENGRSDMCLSGDYLERGIKGFDGYQTEYVVDDQRYFVPVAEEAAPFAVLTEPMSIAEKAIDQALLIQTSRVTSLWGGHALADRKVLVSGLGAVGLLTSLALILRGAIVWGLDIVDHNNSRVTVLERMGGSYLNGREPKISVGHARHFDLIFDATGVARLEFDLLDVLGPSGVYTIMGIPSGDPLIALDAAGIVRRLVLENQVLVGSVNASRSHFQAAVRDLQAAHDRWPGAIESIITARLPYSEYARALEATQEEIKTVLEWASPESV